MVFKSRKGAELALNVVIIAVIALLVLVVVLFIFGSKANVFSKGVSDCLSLSGSCENVECSKLPSPRPSLPNGNCPVPDGADKKFCCAKI